MDIKNYFMQAAVVTAIKTGALKTGAAVAMKTGMLGAFGLPFLGIVAVAGGLYGITKLFDDSVQTK